MAEAAPLDAWPTLDQRLLLRAGLLGEPLATEAWQAWLDRKKRSGTMELDEGERRLAPLVAANLARSGVHDERLRSWAHDLLVTRARNLKHLALLARFIDLMKAEEIPVLPLKGTALILGPYSDPGLRPMADLDVLVPSRFAARAAELLECEGFRRRGCGRDFRIVHSVPFERADGESIDLHAHVFEGGTADSDDDELWAASLPLEMSGRSMRVLAAHHQLLHTIAHGLRWSPSPPCRFLADAFVVLRRARDAFDWSGFVGAAQSRRLALAAATGLALLSEALDVLVPGDVGVRLGAEGVDPLDRRSFEARLRAPHLRGVLDSVALHRSRHRELVHSGVMPRSTVGLLRTAALTWGLDSAWDLPRAALGRLAQRGNANS